MPFRLPPPVLGMTIFVLSGCATMPDAPSDGCSVTDEMFVQDGRTGALFTNQCNTCIAVAFEYKSDDGRSGKTACFVPSETRMVYRDLREYRVTARESCEHVEHHGIHGIGSASEILENHERGKCTLLGAFAD